MNYELIQLITYNIKLTNYDESDYRNCYRIAVLRML